MLGRPPSSYARPTQHNRPPSVSVDNFSRTLSARLKPLRQRLAPIERAKTPTAVVRVIMACLLSWYDKYTLHKTTEIGNKYTLIYITCDMHCTMQCTQKLLYLLKIKVIRLKT